ncbi:MAG: twin-arginine translocation pathway signal, partial [Vicinamibacteria bacterium]
MRRLGATAAVVLSVWSASAASSDAPGEPIALQGAAILLDPTDPAKTRVGKLEFRGGLHLTSTDARFGG